MEIINYKNIAETRYTDRFKYDPVFVAIMDTLISLKEQRQLEYIKFADEFLDIDKSSGVNLDLIGKILGEPRNLINFVDRVYFGFLGAVNAEAFDIGYWYSAYNNKFGGLRILTDEEYRRILKARTIKNTSKTTRNDFLRIINLLTDNSETIVNEKPNVDIKNGIIEITIKDTTGIASYYLAKYKTDNSLIPIPLGFKLSVIYT